MKQRIGAHVMFVLLFTATLANAQSPPYTGCYGQLASGQLVLTLTRFDASTGEVEINGGDVRGPSTPFTWYWGDGEKTQGFFPQTHRYPLDRHTYVLQVISHENDGSSECVQMNIVFPSLPPPLQQLFTWITVGPQNTNTAERHSNSAVSGKLQAFAWSAAQPDLMYAGGGIGAGNEGPFTQAGVLKSTDGARTWTRVNNGVSDTTIDTLWIDPTNPNRLLAGTEYGGIFQTTSAGQLWTPVLPHSPVSAIITVPDGVLAGTGAGLELSTDAGDTWKLLQSTPAAVRCLAAVGSTIIAGLDNGTILWKSPGDQTWRTVGSNPQYTIWDIALDPGDTQTAFYIRTGPTPSTIFRTTDGGNTWQPIDLNYIPQTLAIRSSDRALLVAGGGSPQKKSLDRGATWQSWNANWDVRKIFLIPNSSSLVVGTDHGLHWTDNDGITWRDLTQLTSTNIVYALAVARTTILAAVQDFSSLISFDSGNTWRDYPNLTEGGSVAINPANNSICYAFNGAGFMLSLDGCATFTRVNGPIFRNYVAAPHQNLITIDAKNPANLYLGAYDGVWFSDNWGLTLQHLNWPVQEVTQVLLDPQEAGTRYVCTRTGLYQTLDNGATWTKLLLPSFVNGYQTFPYSATISPADNNTLLVALDAGPVRSGGGVLRTTDRGKTWVFVNTGLSMTQRDLGVDQLSIAFNPLATTSNPVVALATTNGIYASADLGSTWRTIRFNAVPNYFAQVVWNDGYLWAASAGEGILHSDQPVASKLFLPRRHRGAKH